MLHVPTQIKHTFMDRSLPCTYWSDLEETDMIHNLNVWKYLPPILRRPPWIHTAQERDDDRYRERSWHNRNQWFLVRVPVLDQCKHFYIALNFPFGPCTSPSPVPLLREYSIIEDHREVDVGMALGMALCDWYYFITFTSQTFSFELII